MKIKIKVPGKLLLWGDHAVVYGQPCLVMAVNQYIQVTTSIKSVGEESVWVRAARELFEAKYGRVKEGFLIDGFDSRYGLGSSAAVTVAVIRAMLAIKKIEMSRQELFELGYEVVGKVQGAGSGFDVAAAIWQGVIYFVTGGKKIDRLAVGQMPIVVGYSGVKADTATMIKKAERKISEKFLQASAKIVNQARVAVEGQNWQQAGKLMNQNQKLLKDLGVSTEKLDQLIEAAKSAGAYGAKLSGGGGGDCMIAMVDVQHRQKVAKAIEVAGGQILRVKLAL